MILNNKDPMITQALDMCKYVENVSDTLWSACEKAITPQMPGINAKNIYITGCGDSYSAGIAMKSAFDTLVKDAFVFPVRAMDVSRRMSDFRFENSLVISISASGKPSRVVEGAVHARKKGAATLAITSGEQTPLGQVSDTCLVVPKPDVLPSPGILSYVCSCISLAYTAIIMGYIRGKYSFEKAKEYKVMVEEYCGAYENIIPKVASDMEKTATRFKDFSGYDFIGDGGDFATGYFGSCKYVEAFGAFATYDDSENWCHVNYFILNREKMSTNIVITEDSPSYSRLYETIKACEKIERPLFIVADVDREKLNVSDDVMVCTLPKAKENWMSPIMMHLPFDFISAYISQMKNEPNFRSFAGPWSVPNKIGDSLMINE